MLPFPLCGASAEFPRADKPIFHSIRSLRTHVTRTPDTSDFRADLRQCHNSHPTSVGWLLWRRRRDSNPRGVSPKRFSRPPRYDRFDIPASVIFFVFPKRSDARSSLFRRSRSLHDAPHFDRFDIPASVIFYKLRNVTPITKPIIPHQKVKVNPFSRQK